MVVEEKKKRALTNNISTDSSTATYTGGVGSSNVTQTSSNSSSSGGRGSTVAVNPNTFSPDGSSTFRVDSSQVNNPPKPVYVDTQKIGGSSGNRFTTVDGRTGFASSSVSEIREGGRGSGGFIIATNKPIVRVSQGLANKIINDVSTPTNNNKLKGMEEKKVVLSVQKTKPNSSPQSVDFNYSRQTNRAKENVKVNIKDDSLKSFKSSVIVFGKKASITEKVVSTAKNFVIGVTNFPRKFVQGNFEILKFRAQNPTKGGIGSWNPSEDNTKENQAKFKNLIATNQNVKTAFIGDTVVLSSFASPIIATGGAVVGTASGIFDIGKGFATGNAETVGKGTFGIATGLKFNELTRPFVEFKGIKINADNIFGGSVSGRKVTSTSTTEALQQFEVGRTSTGEIDVVTVSPNRLKGLEIKAGAKGLSGIEDDVGYVAPINRANPMFLRLADGSTGNSDVSIGFSNFFASRSTVNIIRVKDVVVPSKQALSESGFSNVNKEFVGQGVAVITKRSIIGKGEIEAQLFSPTKDITLKSGKVYKVGKLYKEGGTSETEAGILQGEIVSRTSGKTDFYTIVNQKKFFGKNIPLTGTLIELPKYKLEIGSNSASNNVGKNSLSLNELNARQSNSISSITSNTRKVGLTSSVGYNPSGSKIGISNINISKGNGSALKSSSAVSSSRVSGKSSSFTSGGSYANNSSSETVLSNKVSSIVASNRGSGSSVFSPSKSVSSSGNSVGFSNNNISQSSSISSRGVFKGTSFVSGKGDDNPINGKDFNVLKSKNDGFGKFGVEVRKGGKFFSVGKGLSFSKAYGKGSSIVGNSASATFRLTQRGKPISVNSQSSSFYSKGTNVIEKRGRRIKSRGELSEITYKGINSQRKRSSVF